jgi:hypothetical protein
MAMTWMETFRLLGVDLLAVLLLIMVAFDGIEHALPLTQDRKRKQR